MRLALRVALASSLMMGVAISNAPPSDISLTDVVSPEENSPLGTVVGQLVGTDPDLGDILSFSLQDDAGGMFSINESNQIIVSGVLDYETATSHTVVVVATDTGGATRSESFVIQVVDVDETPPANPLPEGDIVVDDPESFVYAPTVTVVEDAVKIHGKKKAGSIGKFLHDLGPAIAGTTYDISFALDASLMTNFGRNAAVVFVIKNGNDFHAVGYQGDGTVSGVAFKQIYGTPPAGWQQGTGFTEVDGGAPQNGTQYLGRVRLKVSDDGATYTAQTSGDDGETWDDEFADAVPLPHSTVTSPAQFGIGMIFKDNDTGSFSLAISRYTAVQFEARQFMVSTFMNPVWYSTSAPRQVNVGGTFLSEG